MKTFCLIKMIVLFLLLSTGGMQAQTAQKEFPKVGSEYNVLDAWSGIWSVQGEARDSMSAPWYHVDWTLTGKRILNGYALEILHLWKTKDFAQNGVEITGYDPVKKICMTHIFYDDGTWFNSTPTFTDKRTCIEDGATYYPNGKVEISRWTWSYSDDWMSFVVIGENLRDNNWWKAFEGKGSKINQNN
jgi:hypothetical protein